MVRGLIPIQLNNKKIKLLVYFTLIMGILSYTFAMSIQKGLHQTFSGGLDSAAMGIAISELKYGLKGYQGYEKIRVALNNGVALNQKIALELVMGMMRSR